MLSRGNKAMMIAAFDKTFLFLCQDFNQYLLYNREQAKSRLAV